MATLISQYGFENVYTDSQGTNNLGAGGSGNTFSTTTKKIGSYSLSLNGSGDAKKTSGVTGFNTGNSDLSWGGWINWGSLPANAYITQFGTAGAATSWQMYTTSNTDINLTIDATQNKNISCSLVTGVFQWFWVEYTASTKTWELYINNITQGTNTFTSTINLTNGILYIGNDSTESTPATGFFDDWRYYNGVTSSSERAAIYALGAPSGFFNLM